MLHTDIKYIFKTILGQSILFSKGLMSLNDIIKYWKNYLK